MNTIELSGLERQVDRLLHQLEHLKTENITLRQKLSDSIHKRTLLLEKNRKAVSRVKHIITQLKGELS